MVIFGFQGYFGHFLGCGVILVIFFWFWEYFDNFKVSGVFWSFFRFWGFFCHFLGFKGILVIFWVLGYFDNFQILRVFWSFLGFRGILVIFWVLEIFWSFLGFEGILVIFEDFRVLGHFHFRGILVILIIGLLGGLGFTHNNWVGLGLS